MAVVRMESVTFAYPGRNVFRDLDLAMDEGEILGLVGPNSSGKTTLLKLIGGLLRPQRGRVFLEGKDLSRLARHEVARRVAVVLQEVEVPFAFTAGEIVLLGRAPFLTRFGWEEKEDLEIAAEAMALADVAGLEGRPFGELSGGERQRVLLAKALAQQPKVMLLDEPASHLDLRHQGELHELIRRLNREKKVSVLNISHDLNMAAEYSHRMVLLQRGGIYAVGSPEEVVTEENIRRVYGTTAMVERNPFSNAPRVTPSWRGIMPKSGAEKSRLIRHEKDGAAEGGEKLRNE